MPSSKELQTVLREFNLLGYADESAKYVDNGKNGKIIRKQIGEYKYEDEFYGGEPYSGNETIWFKNKDVFRCVYWGKVAKGIKFGELYDFLRMALMQGPNNNLVHRGPSEFTEDKFKYTNICEGTIDEFRQVERIFINNKEVYTEYFFGGRVNTQED